MKCTEEELSLLIEIRDLLAASREDPEADATREDRGLAEALSRADRALFLLEKNVGDLDTALVDMAEAFDLLARVAGRRAHVARRARGILERRRLR